MRPQSWLAWKCDAIDFFSVSLVVTHLQTQFNRSTHDIVLFLCLKSSDTRAIVQPTLELRGGDEVSDGLQSGGIWFSVLNL